MCYCSARYHCRCQVVYNTIHRKDPKCFILQFWIKWKSAISSTLDPKFNGSFFGACTTTLQTSINSGVVVFVQSCQRIEKPTNQHWLQHCVRCVTSLDLNIWKERNDIHHVVTIQPDLMKGSHCVTSLWTVDGPPMRSSRYVHMFPRQRDLMGFDEVRAKLVFSLVGSQLTRIATDTSGVFIRIILCIPGVLLNKQSISSISVKTYHYFLTL